MPPVPAPEPADDADEATADAAGALDAAADAEVAGEADAAADADAAGREARLGRFGRAGLAEGGGEGGRAATGATVAAVLDDVGTKGGAGERGEAAGALGVDFSGSVFCPGFEGAAPTFAGMAAPCSVDPGRPSTVVETSIDVPVQRSGSSAAGSGRTMCASCAAMGRAPARTAACTRIDTTSAFCMCSKDSIAHVPFPCPRNRLRGPRRDGIPAPRYPMSITPTEERPAAVLVAVQLPDVSDEDHTADLAELGRLVDTLGFEVVATVSQRRPALAPAAVLGEGKLRELAELTGGKGVVPSGAPAKKDKARAKRKAAEEPEDDEHEAPEDEGDAAEDGGEGRAHHGRKATVVVVDHEITPSQARNLERATGAEVLDRTGVIVEIFHRHARSREAKLEVEIARLKYVAPRLREAGGGGDRQRGGIGGKGAGESGLELDKRKIRDRIAELREELELIQKEQDVRREHRKEQQRVAFVGYTNAGKSSLMRGLTGSEVLVADKLFATLDTTVRALHPETKPRILVSDTVGFIKKLPHDLVASFRSTLDEAREASLLLFVADASDPTFRGQLDVTRSTLGEIGAGSVPSKLLLNKIDRVGQHEREALAREFPGAILLSAKDPGDIAALRQTIVDFFESLMVEGEIYVPYSKQSRVSEIFESARVLSEEYDEGGQKMRVLAPKATLARLTNLVEH